MGQGKTKSNLDGWSEKAVKLIGLTLEHARIPVQVKED